MRSQALLLAYVALLLLQLDLAGQGQDRLGGTQAFTLPALELRDPALRTVIGAEAAWSEELRLRCWLAVAGRHVRVAEDPMLIHAYNMLAPEQGGPVTGGVVWYPAVRSEPPVGLIPDALSIELPLSQGKPEDLRLQLQRSTHLIGLSTTGELPRAVFSHAAGGVRAEGSHHGVVFKMLVHPDLQDRFAGWTSERVARGVYPVVAGKIQSLSSFLSPLRSEMHWSCREPMRIELAEKLAREGILQASTASPPDYTRDELAWIRSCDEQLERARREQPALLVVGSASAPAHAGEGDEGDQPLAGVIVKVFGSSGARQGIVVPSLWQCCLGRLPSRSQCLWIQWMSDAPAEAEAFPAQFRAALGEAGARGADRLTQVNELRVLQ